MIKKKSYQLELSAYPVYSKSDTFANLSLLHGELYEIYCYEQLILRYPDIQFIYAHENSIRKKKRGNNTFCYLNNGRLIYLSSGIELGEFDILGIKGNTLYWWEVTRSKSFNIGNRKNIRKKQELLNLLFQNMEIILTIITPSKLAEQCLKNNFLIIEEPEYDKLLKPHYYYQADLSKCITAEKLIALAQPYDYIEDIIEKSHLYFKGAESQYRSDLLERIYPLDQIAHQHFPYFNVEEQYLGKIEEIQGAFYKDDTYMPPRKATCIEIKAIRKRLL